MITGIPIVPIIPHDDGVAAGKALGASLRLCIDAFLAKPYFRDTLGAMSREALLRWVVARMETAPDYGQYPELEDIYPERLEYLRGLAKGAGVPVSEAALYDYLLYRDECLRYYTGVQVDGCMPVSGCSGFIMVGPDGVLAGQCIDSAPPPKPADYRPRKPKPYAGLRQLKPRTPKQALRRPRTGYIVDCGIGNETGVAYFGGGSCGVWLDDEMEDVWPISHVPLLRFARDIPHLAELYRRYNLFNWGRDNRTYADIHGNAMIVEKSFRRVGIRMKRPEDPAIWCTEGHFDSPEMFVFIRAKRQAYLDKTGKHAGADDMQYAADSGVRFTHLGELCHRPWGHGLEHARRIVTNHDLFPRALCRHAGPDTDAYDVTVTLQSYICDLTHNRKYLRNWVPWKRFCCEAPEEVIQYGGVRE